MSDIGIVIAVGLGTVLTRASLVLVGTRVTISDRAGKALSLVAPAVLSALVVQGLFVEDGVIRFDLRWLTAAGIAAFVAWKSRSITATLVSGMIAVWLAGVAFPA